MNHQRSKKIIIILAITLWGNAFAQKKRLVTIGGCVTETVCELGLCDKIVGTDITSRLPGVLPKKVSRLGYFTKISAEGILSLKPTSVISISQLGPRNVLDQVSKVKGVLVYKVNPGFALKDSIERTRQIGKALHRAKAASKLIQDLNAQYAKVKKYKNSKNKPKVLFIYARGGRLVLTGGIETSADMYITLAGGTNVFKAKGFKPISAEVVASSSPEVILLPRGSLQSLNKSKTKKDSKIDFYKSLFELPGVALTPAAKNKAVVTIDDTLLCGIGKRSFPAIKKLNRELKAMKKIKGIDKGKNK